MRRKRRTASYIAGLLIGLLIGSSLWVLGRAFRREQATHDLAVAVYANNTSAALAALRAGADPNTRQRPADKTPTLTQFVRQLWRQMRSHASSQANASAKPPMIALAAAQQKTTLVTALLNAGADPEAQAIYDDADSTMPDYDTSYGYTALQWASYYDRVGMVQALLTHGADPNNAKGCEPPLAFTSDPTVVRLLLEHGANPRLERMDGKFEGMQAIHWAAYCDNIEGVELLCAKGANINARSKYRGTALTIAAQGSSPADLERLIALGTDVNATSGWGETPLIGASEDGRIASIRVLLAHGANPNIKGHDGQTALFFAVDDGQDETVRALIAGGAKVNVKDDDGYTPLQLAENDGNDSVEEILRAAGAVDY